MFTPKALFHREPASSLHSSKQVMRKLLCVTAHPDDEAGGFGGTLLLYHERGVETLVVCMTAGTAARNRGTARTDEELASLRRAEFAASCKMLGITHGEVLDYPDGKLDRVDLYQAVGDIVLRIRQIRPQVMLTFGPDGGLTGHIDHAMAGTFATIAFEWAGRLDRYPEQLEQGVAPHRVQKLYYHTADFVLPDRQLVSPPTVTARIEIGKQRFEKKHLAFQQHITQKPLFERVRKSFSQRLEGTVEMYHLAATCEPREAKLETDLFEDVIEE
jgi:LmbE family N-acetylglucosaminyl deacetylase